MTEEQVNDLWLQFSHLHPDQVKKPDTSLFDEEFEDFEKEMAAEAEGVIYDDTVIIPYGEGAPVFLSVPPAEDEWEDV